MIIPVILSGGAGTRLWPLSRELEPKQLVRLLGSTTLLQKTVQRLGGIPDLGPPVVVCNHAHHERVVGQLAELDVRAAALILEPVGRNTAPAAAVAALHTRAAGADPILLILPADHMIAEPDRFHQAVAAGIPPAEAGNLVTFGIVPESPNTGYGYIEQGENLEGPVSRVVRFVEKPDAETAGEYMASGRHLWNSGMFMFRASRYLEELDQYEPTMLAKSRHALEAAEVVDGALRLDAAVFRSIAGNSIDCAVMERTERAVVIPLDAGWSDVGSWAALWETSHQDERGNVLIGDVLTEDTTGSYVRAGERLAAVVGLQDVVVVVTRDAVLVCSKDRAQDVKTIVERLREANREEAVRHAG